MPPSVTGRRAREPVRTGLAGILTIGLVAGAAAAGPGAVELLSRGDPPSDTAGADGSRPAVSADGRYVAFSSPAANLVAGQVDVGGTSDVFLHDRVAGTTILVSRTAASPVTAGNGDSFLPAVSADGRFVAYLSSATDLVAGQAASPVTFNVLLYDRETQATTLVSHAGASPTTPGDGDCQAVVLSADGRFVAFESRATNLVTGQVDANDEADVFLHDRVTGTTILASRAAGSVLTAGNGSSEGPILSAADGRFVAFTSLATNLVAGQTDPNDARDVFLFDRVAGTTVLVSHAAGLATTTAGGFSSGEAISDDGAFVLFTSRAANLVAGQVDGNFENDLFLYTRVAATSSLVSHATGLLTTAGDDGSRSGVLSGDGSSVAFSSQASNLVAGQVDGSSDDVFLYDRVGGGAVTLISGRLGSATSAGDLLSGDPVISADGQFVAYVSLVQDLLAGQVDAPFTFDVFLYDRGAATTRLVSRIPASALTTGSSNSLAPRLSANGRVVAFLSAATDLVTGLAPSGAPAVYVRDDAAGTTAAVSRRDPARPSASGSADSSLEPRAVSADGRFVVIESRALNLVPGQVDANGGGDVFLVDRQAGTTTLVSRTAASPVTTGNAESGGSTISGDGRVVAFASAATDLVPGQDDTTGTGDIFLYDRETGQTTLVSRKAGFTATAADGLSFGAVISADGRFVAYLSAATDLVAALTDDNDDDDVFLFDRETGTTTLVSRTAASATVTGNARCFLPVISADGGAVVFPSDATDLVDSQSDGNGDFDVFLYDRLTETTTLVSRTAAAAATTGNGQSTEPSVSADGAFVAFRSRATDLVADQVGGNPEGDVYLYDRQAGTTTLVSRVAGSVATAGSGRSVRPVLSADGGFVAFFGLATDLVAGQGDGNAANDVYLYDRQAGTTILVSRVAGSVATAGNGSSETAVISADGGLVAFASRATDLVAGPAVFPPTSHVYLHDRQAGTTLLVSRARPVRGPGARLAASATGNGFSRGAVLSADGTVVAFQSVASDLTADADLNGLTDVFAWSSPCAGLLGSRPCPGGAGRGAPGP